MKLPEIRYRRSVPTLRSPDAAALPGELQSLQAGVSAVRQGIAAGQSENLKIRAEEEAERKRLERKAEAEREKLLEEEARLRGTARVNEAARDMRRDMQDTVQKYLSDRNANPEDFAAEMDAINEKHLTAGLSGDGDRADYYAEPALERLRTQAYAEMLANQQKVINTRKGILLTDQLNDSLADLAQSPDITSLFGHMAQYQDSVSGAGFGIAESEEAVAAGHVAMAQQAITGWVRNGDLESMSEFVDSPLFSQLPITQQEALREEIIVKGEHIYREGADEEHNNLLAMDATYDAAVKRITEAAANVPGMTPDQQKRFVKGEVERTAAAYIQGLLSNDEFDIAESELKKDKFKQALGPDTYASFLGQAVAGVADKTSASYTKINNRLDNELHSVLVEGRAPDPTLRSEAEEMIRSGAGTESQRTNAQIRLDKLDIAEDAGEVMDNLDQMTDQELDETMYSAEEARNEYEGDQTRYNYEAWNAVQKAAQAHIVARNEDVVGYANTHDQRTRDRWANFSQSLAAYLADPDGSTIDPASEYAHYKDALTDAITKKYRRNASNLQGAIPTDSAFVQQLSSALAGADRQTLTGIMSTLTTVMGDDAYDVVMQLSKQDPQLGAVMLATLSGDQVTADFAATGRLRRSTLTIKDSIESIVNSDKNGGVSIPYHLAGEYADEALEAVYTVAVGMASKEELDVGFTPETLQAASDAVLGKPFKINEYSDDTLPYMENGAWVDDDFIRGQFRRLRFDASAQSGPDPQALNGESAPLRDMLDYATPVFTGEPGKYWLDLPASNPWGGMGRTINPDTGEPYVLDIRDVSPQYYRRGVPTGRSSYYRQIHDR